MDTRLCRACGLTKPIESFNVGVIEKNKPYRRHTCTMCEAERKRTWYEANIARERQKRREASRERLIVKPEETRKYFRDKMRLYRERNRRLVLEHYGNSRCACCGESEPTFLSLDHINNDGYERRKAGEPQSCALYYKLVTQGFPPGFQVLCMNCQHGKSRNAGICPHQKRSTTRAQARRVK